jgi:hypothetical protein
MPSAMAFIHCKLGFCVLADFLVDAHRHGCCTLVDFLWPLHKCNWAAELFQTFGSRPLWSLSFSLTVALHIAAHAFAERQRLNISPKKQNNRYGPGRNTSAVKQSNNTVAKLTKQIDR